MSHVGLYYICAHAEQASYAMLRTPMVHDNVTKSSTEKTHEQVRGRGGGGGGGGGVGCAVTTLSEEAV